MDYNFNLEHPFFFTNNDYSTDTSIKYQVSLPFNWHEVMNNDEWVYQYPIGKFVERQGWKIHISSEYNSSHELLQDVAKICHEMRIPFKHLSTEDKFIMRNGKLVSRGFSGKFITCYPNQNELESVLQRLESALKQYNGPYILSDKRWDEAPIYLRYGVFRPSRDDEKKVAIDELIVGDEVVKDERLPVFKIPKGIVPPDFLNKWLDKKDKKQGDFPFIIDNAIRFSNSGGIYNARLKEDGKKIILKEARPYTGLGFDGTYSSEKLASECKALKILNEWSETPKIYWHGKIWEHTFLGIEHMKGVPLNRWVTNNFPLYDNCIELLKEREVTIEDMAALVIFSQQKYYPELTLDDASYAIQRVLKKREVQNVIMTGIELDKLAEAQKLSPEFQKIMEKDNPLYGIDEVIVLSILNLYGSIAFTNYGYLDKLKPLILERLNENHEGVCNVFLDDIVGAIAAAACSKIAHNHASDEI